MNVLIVGSGKGSFEMRGRQLGAAIGAKVVSAPSDDNLRWADVVVLIKRAGAAWAALVHRFGKPVVWDALDFWAQPSENGLTKSQAMAMLAAHIRTIRPTLTIGATEAQAKAAGGVYLPHHSWQGLTPAPARAVVTTVGYQGIRKYLGRWGQAVEAECQLRGWQFVINPSDLRDCDILVAFRDGEWDGWMCREWKSGVKLANAVAAGRPIIAQPSAAFSELDPTGSAITSLEELPHAFDVYAGGPWRGEVDTDAYCQSESLRLSNVATRYRQILQGVAKAKAA